MQIRVACDIIRLEFDAFTAANPYIHIDVALKKLYGISGMLDFLATSADLPDQLHDLATLDFSKVPSQAFHVLPSGIFKASDIWRTAMEVVWRGQMTPEEAARCIAAVLK